jgi:hypothetical protein
MKWLLFGALLLPGLALGFEPLNTDDAGTVGAGRNQIEQYFISINRNGGGSQSTDLITPGEEYSGRTDAKAYPFTYTRGLSDSVEASFSSTYYNQPSGNYSKFANYVLGAKWRFYEDESNGYALAIKPTVVLPAGKQQQVNGLGLAATNYGLNLIASKYWQGLEVHLNASYMRSPYNTNYSIGQTDEINRTNIFLVSIAPVLNVSEQIKLALDLGASTNPPATEQTMSHYALVAGIYSVNDNVDIGLSYMRTGLSYSATLGSKEANATRNEVGVTWRF